MPAKTILLYAKISFVTNAIIELLFNNFIEEIPNCPHIVNPLSVSTQPSGKQRLILDLRHVNQCVYKQEFIGEDIRTIVSLTEKDIFLFNFDLKSAYHHVEICPDHRQYLVLHGNLVLQVTRYFQFCVLPVWPFIRALSMHEITSASTQKVEATGNSSCSLFRRRYMRRKEQFGCET